MIALLVARAHAQAWDFSGVSPRDVAMAGAGVAAESPGVAIAVDPASIGSALALGYRGSFPDIAEGSTPVLDGHTSALDLSIAGAHPIGRAALGGGFALYLPLPAAIDTSTYARQSDLQAPVLDDALDFPGVAIVGNVSFGVVSIGAGAQVGIDLPGADTDIVLSGLEGEQTDEGLDISNNVHVDTRRRLTWDPAPLVGAHAHRESWDAFASWRGALGTESEGTLVVDPQIGTVVLDPANVPLALSSAWSPSRLALGFATGWGRFHPSLALRYLWTSDYRDTQQQSPPVAWHDTIVPAAAVELAVGDLLLRGGYAFVPSPMPDEPGTGFVDADRHTIAAGVAVDLEDTQLAIAGQLQVLDRSMGQIATLTAGVRIR